MRKHSQHELALDLGESLKQGLEIIVSEVAVVMSAVSPDIRRVNEMEGILAVVTLDDMSPVLAFDGDIVQPCAQLLGELLLGVPEFQSGRPRTVIAESAVYHGCEAELGAEPYSPRPFHRSEVFRKLIDMPCVGVFLTRVQRSVHHLLEFRILVLRNLVEIDQLGVDVVDDLAVDRSLAKEDSAPSAEGFRVELVFWNQRKDMLEQRLLSSVIGYGCFHYRIDLNLTSIIMTDSAIRGRAMAIHLTVVTAGGGESLVSVLDSFDTFSTVSVSITLSFAAEATTSVRISVLVMLFIGCGTEVATSLGIGTATAGVSR